MTMQFAWIDPDVLLRTVDGNEESFRHLLRVFLKVMPDMQARLEAGLREANRETIRAQAHSMKSAMELVGAVQTADKLAQLEKAAYDPLAHPPVDTATLGDDIACVLAEVRMCLGPSALAPYPDGGN